MKKMLGVMLDCSRNAVLRPDTVKKYADIIKKMGYNTLMLYTEDTYTIDTQPLFGHLRGRYSKEELMDIDSYCMSIGIELVPCIQTLAHLDGMFKWSGQYEEIKDCDDILLCGNEKTYKLIEDMISSLSVCFSSRKIHIGMDEAYRVGTGKYQILNGARDRFDILNEHLTRVCEIVKKYDFEPMMWSDMFRRLALDIDDQYADVDNSKILSKSQLPRDISLVYWDYYSEDYDRYAGMIKTDKMFGRKLYFAGAAWTWKGFAPDNEYSMRVTLPAIKACKDLDVDGMFFTLWGDDGAECSAFSVLPALMYAAEVSKGNEDMDSIKAKFKEITGCDFDSFMLFDKLDTPGGKHSGAASKYLFYNDIFMGLRDYLCSWSDNEYYNKLCEDIRNTTDKGEFGCLFDVYASLSDVLFVKSCLGLEIRKAYIDKDMDGLKECIRKCDVLTEKLHNFHTVHQKRWFLENKPHGFDVQDIRIGGLIQRVASCKERLERFVNGEIGEIPELKEPVISELNGHNHWGRVVTPNRITYEL